MRKGAVPNCGSSGTWSLASSMEGSGNRPTDGDSTLTGRPIACAGLEAIIAWTRGVSTRRGSAIAAPTSRSTATAPIPTSHFKARFNRAPPERLRGLDRRQPPGLRADRSREGPVLLDVHRRGRPLHHRAGRVVDRVVHERDGEVHRHPVLPALLPSLGQLRPTDPDALDSVRPPCASELVTLGLETRVLLRCESVLHCGQIPLSDTALDIGERDLRPLGEAVGIEARVHSTEGPETALEVGDAR